MLLPQSRNVDEVRFATGDANYKASSLLCLMHDRYEQADGNAQPLVVNSQPAKPFQRPTEVQEKHALFQRHARFSGRDVVRATVETEQFQYYRP